MPLPNFKHTPPMPEPTPKETAAAAERLAKAHIDARKYDQLLSLLNPLIDFMIENKFSYFVVAGKDGTCSRHLNGEFDDLSLMLSGMMEKNPQVKQLIKDSLAEVELPIEPNI